MNIEQEVKDLKSRVLELENIKNPLYLQGKMINLFQQQDLLQTQLTTILNKLNAMYSEVRFIELFEDKELNDLYLQSGLSSLEVKDFIEKTFNSGQAVSQAVVSKYVNGEISDLKVRSYLGRYFREKCGENTKAIKRN